MAGANPKSARFDRRARVIPPGAHSRDRTLAVRRCLAVLGVLLPLSLVLGLCGKAPSAGALAANASAGDTFEERFPAPQFKDRFPTGNETVQQRQLAAAPRAVAAQAEPAPYRVASLAPTVPFERAAREEQTMLVGLKSSAFPYLGNNPRTDAPFLNVSGDGRRGHRGPGGRVYWQDETYNDNRTLIHIPRNFDVRKPGVVVVFFHGNGATLERDVRDRQLVPQQISQSGVNAVLLAPQLAVDAVDSSAGKFWQPGGFKRFMEESADRLAQLYGDPGAAKAFAAMPVVIVGYSGGYVPTAWSLAVGGLGNRVRGVFLLDAVYGELDKFASWIENNRSGFFVSSYTRFTKPRDRQLIEMLRDKGITVTENMDGPLRPGSVVFVQTPKGVTHRDYVTQAWTEHPVREVLAKMAASPALTRIASGPQAASR